MDSPQNTIWGPHLWMILHTASEKIGIYHTKLPQEEVRVWTNLLNSLRYSLPCPLCKKHYTLFYSANPITAINRDFIRNWLYNLHSDINIKLGRENSITIDKIPEIYSNPINFNYHLNIINQQMLRAIRLGWCSREDIQRTLRFFQELKRFYDFF